MRRSGGRHLRRRGCRKTSAVNHRIVCGTANRALASEISSALGAGPVAGEVERFPDGELRPSVDGVRDDDVFIVQSTGPPVNDNLVELLLMIDACRRAGADRVTAVVPYFGYARQDRRSRGGQAIGARMAASAIAAAGADRLVVIDPHTAALEAMFAIPVEPLTAVPAIAHTLLPAITPDAVVVAPDLGAVKLAEHYASVLGLPVVIVRKTRVTGASVRAEELVGQVDGRPVIVVDDMISTGATIEAAVRLLLENGARPDIVVAATHGLFVGNAVERLAGLPLRRLIVTDSLAGIESLALPVEVTPIAPLLAAVIGRNTAMSPPPTPDDR
jgi:ribose-phosphate pyrophosphokinase